MIYCDKKEIHDRKHFSGCFVRSEHRFDILNANPIRKEHLKFFITEPFIEKMVSFWNSVKKFRRSHQRWSIKKLFLKIWQYSQENTYTGVSFNHDCHCIKRDSKTGVFLWILQNFEEHLFYRTSPGDCFWKHSLVVTNLFFVRITTKQLLRRLTWTCSCDCYQLAETGRWRTTRFILWTLWYSTGFADINMVL